LGRKTGRTARRAGGVVQGRQPLLVPLALDDHEARVAGDGVEGQADKFRHPQARGVEQLDHAAEAKAGRPVLGRRRLDQPLDFGPGQHLGQGPALFRRIDPAGRIVGAPALAQHELVEAPQGRAAAGGGGGGQAGGAQVVEIGLDVLGARVGEITAAAGEEAGGVG
jgi:hypothetical protein